MPSKITLALVAAVAYGTASAMAYTGQNSYDLVERDFADYEALDARMYNEDFEDFFARQDDGGAPADQAQAAPVDVPHVPTHHQHLHGGHGGHGHGGHAGFHNSHSHGHGHGGHNGVGPRSIYRRAVTADAPAPVTAPTTDASVPTTPITPTTPGAATPGAHPHHLKKHHSHHKHLSEAEFNKLTPAEQAAHLARARRHAARLAKFLAAHPDPAAAPAKAAPAAPLTRRSFSSRVLRRRALPTDDAAAATPATGATGAEAPVDAPATHPAHAHAHAQGAHAHKKHHFKHLTPAQVEALTPTEKEAYLKRLARHRQHHLHKHQLKAASPDAQAPLAVPVTPVAVSRR